MTTEISTPEKCKCTDGKCFINQNVIDDCFDQEIVPRRIYQVAYTERRDNSVEYYLCDTFQTALRFSLELINADIDKNMGLLYFKDDKIIRVDESKIFKDKDYIDFNSFIRIRKVPFVAPEVLNKDHDFYFNDLLYFKEESEKHSDYESDSDDD